MSILGKTVWVGWTDGAERAATIARVIGGPHLRLELCVFVGRSGGDDAGALHWGEYDNGGVEPKEAHWRWPREPGADPLEVG